MRAWGMTVPGRALQDAGVTFHPPATPEALQALEDRLGFPLPEELQALYLDRNGEQESWEPVLLARLQNLDELNATLDEMDEYLLAEAPALRGLFVPLWTDDNGNYFVYFLHGAERGMIGWTHHEAPCFIAPHYRDMTGLYLALLEAYQQGAFDLVQAFTGDAEIGERETQVFEAHLAAYAPTLDAPLRQYHGALLLTLCPPGREGDLLPLLHDRELAVLTSALLARRNCQWALKALTDAVREHALETTLSYNLLGAITTLDAPGTDEALLGLARGYPVTLSAAYLADALERRGFVQERPRNAQNRFDHARIKVDAEPGGWLLLPWQ